MNAVLRIRDIVLRDQCFSRQWSELRSFLLERLKQELKKGLVDEDIVDVLTILNSNPCIVTSSSCSGRIALFAASTPSDKKHGGIVAKWHRPILLKDLLTVLENERILEYEFVWISSQPVILGLHTCSIQIASEVLRAVEKAGFKYSGMKFSHNSFYYVLVLGTERIDIPLRVGRHVFIDTRDVHRLEGIISILNTYLAMAKRKVDRLKRAFTSLLPILEKECEEATLD